MSPYKIKIIYKLIDGVHFTAEATTLSEAYKYISAIIKTNALMFPRMEETLSEMIKILAKMDAETTYSFEQHLFRIEKCPITGEKQGGTQ